MTAAENRVRLLEELDRVERLIRQEKAADVRNEDRFITHLEGRRDVLRWELKKAGVTLDDGR